MAASMKSALIGIFVLVAISVIVFMLLFLHPSVGNNAKTLHVRFTNIDKVNIGTRVTYAGRPLGEVVEIKELPDARTGRVDVNGQIYVYELTLNVDSSVAVFNTDTLTLHTSGLLGERNIDINPQPLKPGEELYLVDDEILYAQPSPSVEEILKKYGELSTKFDLVLSDLHKAIVTVRKEKIIESIGATAKNVADISKSFNQPERIDQFMSNLVKFTDSLNVTWKTVDKSANEFYTSSVNVRDATTDIKKMAESISHGEGSIGRLFMKDDIYLKVRSILNKGDNLVSDISHYGILFQNNKQWQRLNARREKMLQQLSNPDTFSVYFDNEMNQINDSLSSVNQMLHENPDYPYAAYENGDFRQRFADLLRQVSHMENSLKLYNQQVADQEPNWQYNRRQ